MRNSDAPPGAALAMLPPAPETQNAPESEVYAQTVDEVLARLDTDGRSGLSQQQVKERLGRYGKNEATAEAPGPAWRKFLAQFSDVLVILLISAGLPAFFSDAVFELAHDADPTRRAVFDLAAIAAGVTRTFALPTSRPNSPGSPARRPSTATRPLPASSRRAARWR